MARAQLSILAREDINGIALHIEKDRPDAAPRFLDAVDEAIDLLASVPNLGHPYQHQRHAALRYHSVRGFRQFLIFYEPTTDGIYVVRVLHGERDIPAVLDSPKR